MIGTLTGTSTGIDASAGIGTSTSRGALANSGSLGLPLRRIGHGGGGGHGFFHPLGFHWLFFRGLWAIFVLIVVLAVVAFGIRWLLRRRSPSGSRSTWR